MCASSVPLDCVSTGLSKQRFKQSKNVQPMLRQNKELNDCRTLAPRAGDCLRTETHELAVSLKAKHLRPIRSCVNLVEDDLTAHFVAIALAERHDSVGKARYGFESHQH